MPQFIDVSDRFVVAWAPAVTLYVWRAEPTMDAIRASMAAIRATQESTPEGTGVLLGLVERDAPPPRAPVRAALAELMHLGEGFFRASALVCEAQGFQASTVRLVASELEMRAGWPFPHHVYDAVPKATQWLAEQCDSVRAKRLQTMISQVRMVPRRSSGHAQVTH